MKRSIALLYLLNLGLIGSGQSSAADETPMNSLEKDSSSQTSGENSKARSLEQDIHDYVEKNAKGTPKYAQSLCDLARMYAARGMNIKAEELFQQAF